MNEVKTKMRVLVACEESQVVTLAFREKGHESYSCDLQECGGPRKDWHLQMDMFEAFEKHGPWDMVIAHPPCTYLATTGNRWLYHPDDKHLPVNERRPHPLFPERQAQSKEAEEFFMRIAALPVDKLVIENPLGVMSTRWRKPDQIIQPYQFGEPHSKRTCLWMKNVPKLTPTNIVEPFSITYKSGCKMPLWYVQSPSSYARSQTFPGVAAAFADQWG